MSEGISIALVLAGLLFYGVQNDQTHWRFQVTSLALVAMGLVFYVVTR